MEKMKNGLEKINSVCTKTTAINNIVLNDVENT